MNAPVLGESVLGVPVSDLMVSAGQAAEAVSSGLWLLWLLVGVLGALALGCLLGLVRTLRKQRGPVPGAGEPNSATVGTSNSADDVQEVNASG